MRVKKTIIGRLNKCYSLALLAYNGKQHIIVAAEKQDPCYLFDLNGTKEEKIWDGPGGTMSMVQVPGSNGRFLATHKFYSPNDSKEARIVTVTPDGHGEWTVKTLAEIPFVHRFDILERNGVRYLFVCTLKSGHEHKDDWSSPGKVLVCALPDDLSVFDEENPLPLKVVRDGLLKNHGYTRDNYHGIQTGIVSSADGVFRFIPPEQEDGEWDVRQLLDVPASDAVLMDLDSDGEKEILLISPFHGDDIRIYHAGQEHYRCVYEYPEKAEFAHGILGGNICGKPRVLVGHRGGTRRLLSFTYNQEKQVYETEILDEGAGAANICYYEHEDRAYVVAANRETDEIAMYELESGGDEA